MVMTDGALGAAAAFMASVTWSIGSATYSRLSHFYPAHTVNFVRAVIALPIFVALSAAVALSENRTPLQSVLEIPWNNVSWLVVSNVCSYAFGDILFLASTRMVGIPTALAIASTYPFYAAVFGWVFASEVLSPQKIFGLVVTVSGTILVVLAGRSIAKQSAPSNEVSSESRFRLGLVLAFFASLAWSLNSFSSARGSSGINTFDANVVRMGVALFLVPLIGVAVERRLRLSMTREDTKRFLGIFILESVVGSCFYIYAMSHASLAVAATLTSLAPVLTLPFAVYKGWERFSFRKTVGILCVVLGIWFLV